ncbi:MAG: sensor histidine kinase [Chloroflexi bacterium]|nr:sensor histidine kinase [Chloroflexota bacterium]
MQSFLDDLKNAFAPSPDEVHLELQQVRGFFLLVMLALLLLYGIALRSNPALLAPPQFILFTGLMLLHGVLHWFSPRITYLPRLATPYLVIQGTLAFTLTAISQNISLAFGLYMGLIGEAIGILRRGPKAVVSVFVYLALSGVNYGLLTQWQSLAQWMAMALPSALFVIVYVVLYGRQAEARARAQTLLTELETAHRQLTEYANQVEDLTLAAERQRMARELHDTLAQGLAGLILQLEAANSHLSESRPERAQAILQQAMSRARSTLADSRRAIDDLRGGFTGDIVDSIREEVNRFSNATGIPCSLDLAPLPPIPEPIREHTLRAVSEGLSNVARHAQAKQASVRLACVNGWLDVEVRDDGVGFDAAASGGAGHYGLLGMRERARLAGGVLEIASESGRGSTLKLRLPM